MCLVESKMSRQLLRAVRFHLHQPLDLHRMRRNLVPLVCLCELLLSVDSGLLSLWGMLRPVKRLEL